MSLEQFREEVARHFQANGSFRESNEEYAGGAFPVQAAQVLWAGRAAVLYVSNPFLDFWNAWLSTLEPPRIVSTVIEAPSRAVAIERLHNKLTARGFS